MPSCIGIKGRDPNEPVNTAFPFQETVGEWAIELESGTFYPGTITILPVEFSNCPPLLLAIHAIHPGKDLRPVLALCTTCTTIYLYYGGEFVFRLVERAFEFCFLDGSKGLVVGVFNFFLGGFTSFPEVMENGKILYGCFNRVEQPYPVFMDLDLLEDSCSALVIIPETG